MSGIKHTQPGYIKYFTKHPKKSLYIAGIAVCGTVMLAYSGYDLSKRGFKPYDVEKDLTGKTYIVTGATSGLGKQLAAKLANKNARVILACRDREKCIAARREIVIQSRNKEVFCRQCDLSDFDSVKTFVEKLYKGKLQIDRVDGLVNNAAMVTPKRQVNKDGIEMTLATNHMGNFLLTALLLDRMLKQDTPSRIVFVNTDRAAIYKKPLDLFKLNNIDENDKFNGDDVYVKTKIAQLMFAKELSERLEGSQVSVLATAPCRFKSDLYERMPHRQYFLSRWLVGLVGIIFKESQATGACRIPLCALAEDSEVMKNGAFINSRKHDRSWGPNAEDKALRERLWLMSEKWTRISNYLRDIQGLEEHKEEAKQEKSWKYLWLA
ncbi:short chain dehydrogenase domain-containing protein [Ditylenchus destructor]|uniref:Short chain dehydrogenase domain-containing protein n=1 Tax=Ditylenchus destructor TaxID=166010 RepID=A0AAD4R382_9BILA|nr:short chain dehydrogenase domain-containing protein [Ditylenchus destructor]